MSAIDLALGNLLSPVVLFFALGLFAAIARSDLTIPEAVAKGLAIYLMMAIGLKGGVEVAKQGLTAKLVLTIGAGAVLSFALPFLAYAILRTVSRLSPVNAAAVAAHYGSISAVTLAVGIEVLGRANLPFEGYLIAVAAVMETPAILAALLIVSRSTPREDGLSGKELFHEIALNGSVVVLVGSFIVGWIAGPAGMKPIAPLFTDLFRGILCLFLLDMGLVAGRGFARARKALSPPVILFGIAMPLISAAIAAPIAALLGLSPGGAMLFITLAASSSYIAVPAAMRLALPEADAAIYLTLSLGVTFPFNLAIGLPLYLTIAQHLAG
ncbi:MAG: sodium-dependent bicarbonate transport family permease [Beijerinckiaceae bacterium]|nr:sodium-dependent bicarbonate transport family permease [Beijerinckiaceae bacterium]